MAEAHWVALLFDGAQQLVKNGTAAAVGRDDAELKAPERAALGDAEQFALIFVQGELVEFYVTGATGDRVRRGCEAIDTEARFETEHFGGEVLLFVRDDLLAEVLRADVERLGPAFAVLEVETSGGFVARGYPDIRAFGF